MDWIGSRSLAVGAVDCVFPQLCECSLVLLVSDTVNML
jgi:hypothetical protein